MGETRPDRGQDASAGDRGRGGRPTHRPRLRRPAPRFLVLIVAALAVAGTTASPQPPPLATAQTHGQLEVDPKHPIASVVVTLSANAAAAAIPGARTASRIDAGPSDPANAAVVIVEPLDAAERPWFGGTVHTSGSIGQGCAAGASGAAGAACSGRYRITAVLLDPAAERAIVDWGASLELRVDGAGRPSTAPEGARVSAAAGEVVARDAADLRRAVVKTEKLHLDAEHPLASRFIALTQPAGDAGVSADGAWLPFLTVTDTTDGTGTAGPTMVRLLDADTTPITSGGRGIEPFLPPPCLDAAGCTRSYRLDLGVPGGPGDRGRDVEWSVAVVAFEAGGTAPPPPTDVMVAGRLDLGPASPHLDASRSGTFAVRKASPGAKVAIVTIDASTMPQAAGHLAGYLQITYEVRAGGPSAARVVNLGLAGDVGTRSIPGAYGQVAPGASVMLGTAVVAADCSGRTRCDYAVPFNAAVADDGPEIALDWTITARWFPDGDAVPAGLALTNEISAAPSTR